MNSNEDYQSCVYWNCSEFMDYDSLASNKVPCSEIKYMCTESGKYTAAQCSKLFKDCPTYYDFHKGICGKPMQKFVDQGLSDDELVAIFVDCLVKKGWGLFGRGFAQFFKKSEQ